MKECDIFRGSKHTVTPPTYFQGVRTPQPPPQDLRPWCYDLREQNTCTVVNALYEQEHMLRHDHFNFKTGNY